MAELAAHLHVVAHAVLQEEDAVLLDAWPGHLVVVVDFLVRGGLHLLGRTSGRRDGRGSVQTVEAVRHGRHVGRSRLGVR